MFASLIVDAFLFRYVLELKRKKISTLNWSCKNKDGGAYSGDVRASVSSFTFTSTSGDNHPEGLESMKIKKGKKTANDLN